MAGLPDAKKSPVSIGWLAVVAPEQSPTSVALFWNTQDSKTGCAVYAMTPYDIPSMTELVTRGELFVAPKSWNPQCAFCSSTWSKTGDDAPPMRTRSVNGEAPMKVELETAGDALRMVIVPFGSSIV